MTHDEDEVLRALADAHIPSLAMSLIHMTGDASLLETVPLPVYEFWGDGQGNILPDTQEAIRVRAAKALQAWTQGDRPPAPDDATLARMMSFIAGMEIPAHYLPMLREELGIAARDTRAIDPSDPALRAAAGKLKVLIVGAGMSGLLSAIKLRQAGIAFEIVEKNEDVGGTWFENSYPGVRVDNPNHLYGYSFEPNHEWPQHYSTGDVLLEYFRRVADKHELRPHIRFETQVVRAAWDEAAAKWRVTLRDSNGGETESVADAVISAVGQLNQPKFPDIPGQDSFEGVAFHSARWRHDVDLSGKRVCVIGTGASAFQFVPEIAPSVGHLTVFQRTPTWMGPTANYFDEVTDGKKWLLEHVPFYDKWYRFWLFWTMTDGLYEAVKIDPDWNGPPGTISAVSAELRTLLAEKILEQVPDRPDLAAKAIPDFAFGGKRSLRDNGVWLAALKRPNVELVTDRIVEIVANGVKTADGRVHECDVLIYGTGFHASKFLRTFEIVGREGRKLHDVWKGDARAYLGMTTPGFPNFFMLYGPNTNIVVNGSIIFFSECSVRYVMGCLGLLAERGAKTLDVKRDVHDAFNAKVDAANRMMAWGHPGVSSWYKNDLGRVSQNWPFPLVEYWQATLKPDPKDFEIA